MDAVDNNYIEKAITTLMGTVGLKEPADRQTIESLINSGEVKEGITAIARYLGLPIAINLSYVSDEYKPGSSDGFRSSHLVKTDSHGRGTDSITAQISIPRNLPFYGSSGLVNLPINVRVRENCVDHPMAFAGLMAHELSHIVLHSMRHKERENEFYTDLTAMMLGFAQIMALGRKVASSTRHGNIVTTRTVTYGYLSDSNFDFASEKIDDLLKTARSKKNDAMRTIQVLEEDLRRKTVTVSYFKYYLAYLDKNSRRTAKRIRRHDGHWIASFHQPDYIDEFVSATHKIKDQLRKFRNFVQNLNRYDESRFNTIQKYEEAIRAVDLEKKHDRIRGAVIIMKRYVSLRHRLSTYIKIRLHNRARDRVPRG
jgi:hypothetical protein